MLSNERFRTSREFQEPGAILFPGLIPHGDANIPQKSSVARAFNRSAPEHFLKFGLAQSSQPFEGRREEPRGEARLDGHRRFAIPGANILAYVAPENVISHQRAKGFGDGSAKFDSEIGNAEPGVESLRRNGIGRAGVDAAGASTAAVGRRLSGFEMEGGQNLRQEEPGPLSLINQASVLADPPEPGLSRVRTLQERRGIEANLVVEPFDFKKRANQVIQTPPHDVVIIVAPGVAGNPGSARLVEVGRARLGTVVEHTNTDHGPGRRKKSRWRIAAICPVISEIAHLPRFSGNHPILIARRVCVRLG